MTPQEFVTQVLNPGLAWCAQLPGWNVHFDDRARVLLTAISGQEANWTDRIQSGNGPAHGLWQMERRGGVAGVLGGAATWVMAVNACKHAGIDPTPVAAWGALATAAHDNLAVGFARLLLWSDPAPLPSVGDEEAAYGYYIRNWRPGAPSRERWSQVYPQALAAIKEKATP
jgi:hypothetical protein